MLVEVQQASAVAPRERVAQLVVLVRVVRGHPPDRRGREVVLEVVEDDVEVAQLRQIVVDVLHVDRDGRVGEEVEGARAHDDDVRRLRALVVELRRRRDERRVARLRLEAERAGVGAAHHAVLDPGVDPGVGVGRLHGADRRPDRAVLAHEQADARRRKLGPVVVDIVDDDRDANRRRQLGRAAVDGERDELVPRDALPVQRLARTQHPESGVQREVPVPAVTALERVTHAAVEVGVDVGGRHREDARPGEHILRDAARVRLLSEPRRVVVDVDDRHLDVRRVALRRSAVVGGRDAERVPRATLAVQRRLDADLAGGGRDLEHAARVHLIRDSRVLAVVVVASNDGENHGTDDGVFVDARLVGSPRKHRVVGVRIGNVHVDGRRVDQIARIGCRHQQDVASLFLIIQLARDRYHPLAHLTYDVERTADVTRRNDVRYPRVLALVGVRRRQHDDRRAEVRFLGDDLVVDLRGEDGSVVVDVSQRDLYAGGRGQSRVAAILRLHSERVHGLFLAVQQTAARQRARVRVDA